MNATVDESIRDRFESMVAYLFFNWYQEIDKKKLDLEPYT